MISMMMSVGAASCADPRSGGNGGDNNGSDCPAGSVRVGGACRPVGENNGANNVFNNPTNNGGNPTNNATNNSNNATNNGNNPTNNGNNPTNNGGEGCVTGASRCATPTTLERCTDPANNVWEPQDCPDGQICNRGACRAPICEPGNVLGCAGQYSQAICNATGTGTDPQDCEGGLFCREGVCTDRICSEGETSCSGDEIVTVCAPDGTEFVEGQRCGSGAVCDQGECVSLCELTRKESTYLGCDYWAVDLDNIERDSGNDRKHAIVVSNPNTELTAEVTIRLGDTVLNLGDPMVPPGTLRTFETPLGNHIDGSGVFTRRAYRVDSTIPVTVHQFNPLNGEDVFTNDASLLLPSNALGHEYLLMTWQHRSTATGSLSGYGTVVAVEEGITRVAVRPTVNVAAGPGIAGGITAGQERTFELEQGQVLSVSTSGPQSGADLTGTQISADKNIVVYAGHECANIPTASTNWCDHIEQQLFPLEAWGTQYFAVPFSTRNPAQVDTWTILAGADNVFVRTNPPQPIDGVTLSRGQAISFPSNQAFKIGATGPILVGQFLHGSNYAGFSASPLCCPAGSSWNAGRQCCAFVGSCVSDGTGIGDPAFTLSVPVEQYREDYIVLTPPAYEQDFLNIVAPTGSTVQVDGNPVNGFVPIGNTGFSFVQLTVGDNIHTVTGSEPFALVAYGYDCDVSYAYPGGLNLGAIER